MSTSSSPPKPFLWLADELRVFVSPLQRATTDSAFRDEWLRRLGLSVFVQAEETLNSWTTGVCTLVEQVQQAIALAETASTASLADLVDIIGQCASVLNTLFDATSLSFDGLPAAPTILKTLLADLVQSWLERAHPITLDLMLLLGLADLEPAAPALIQDEDGTLRWVFPQLILRPKQVVALLLDPEAALGETYAENPADKLVVLLARLLSDLGLIVRRPDQDKSVSFGALGEGNTRHLLVSGQTIPVSEAAMIEIELLLALLATDDRLDGFVFGASGSLTLALPTPGWSTALTMSAPMLAFGLRRDVGLKALVGQTASIRLSTEKRAPTEGAPVVHAGGETGTRLDIDAISAELWASLDGGTPDVGVAARMEGFKLIIAAGDGDAFLSKALGDHEIDLDMDLGITWSRNAGLALEGGADLAFDIPVNLSIAGGVLEIQTLHGRVNAGLEVEGEDAAATLAVTLGASIGLKLGPFAAVVDDMGLKLAVASAEHGNLGGAALSMAFKPPTGVGFSIDAKVVSGGGFLEFAPDIGRYSGILALQTPAFGFGAIGIVTTKPKDPQLAAAWTGPDFSLFFSLFATFRPPIQLGFGFGLGGVGGLFAVNRRMDRVALRAAVRADSLDAILFPDPDTIIKDAPRILSTIESVFPVAEGSFVFGPMLAITYGAPDPFITAMLGVFVSLPEPLVIALLGRVQLALPNPDSPVLRLDIDVAGVLDFGEGLFALDAKIGKDSKLLTFDLSGEMAMRLRWKGQPSFLFSVGGFHPAFEPPADVGQLERMGLAMDFQTENKKAGIHLGFQSYFALTPNTLQFGASLSIHGWLDLSIIQFDLDGYAGFDAMMTFRPFAFQADMQARVTVTSGGTELVGVDLDLGLDGPRPCWHIQGSASFRFLGEEYSKDFEAWFGAEKPEPVTYTPVRAPLIAALTDDRSWQEGAGLDGLVRLREICPSEIAEGRIWARPDGKIEVRQRIVPLGIKLEQLGAAEPALGEEGPYTLSGGRVGADNAVVASSASPALDHFAPGAFLNLSPHERLTGRSFVKMQAGISFSDTTLLLPTVAPGSVELTWERKPRTEGGWVPTTATTATSAEASRSLSVRRKVLTATAPGLAVAERSFGLVNGDTAAPVDAVSGTWVAARAARKARLLADATNATRSTIAPITSKVV